MAGEERRCPQFARKPFDIAQGRSRVDIGPTCPERSRRVAAFRLRVSLALHDYGGQVPQVIAGAYPATPASPCARANLNALFRGPPASGDELRATVCHRLGVEGEILDRV